MADGALWDRLQSAEMDGKRTLAALALGAAFVAACGGAPATTGAGASAAGTQSAATGGAATSAPTNAAAATSAAPSGPKLSDILGAAKLSQYKVTYKITVSGAGADAFSGDQTWYFKPPRSRFDFGMTAGGQKSTISFFTLPEGSSYCMSTGGQATCFTVGGVGSPLDQNLAAVTQRSLIEHPESYGATSTAGRTIAGQQGLCYTVNPVASAVSGFSTGTFCYSREGIALLSQFSAQGSSWSMEATNVSTTVPDSDFTLPAKPTTYP